MRKYWQYGIAGASVISLICLGINLYYVFADQDITAPIIRFEEENIEVSIEDDSDLYMQDVSAWNDREGDISDRVFIEAIEKDISEETAVFDITYAVFDSSNNIGKRTRKLTYTDYKPPHFTINTALSFPKTGNIDIMTVVQAEDCIDGNISSFVKVKGSDIFSEDLKNGIYNCTLEVTNSVGDIAQLPVNIEIYEETYEKRTFAPAIYLTEYVVYLNQGDKFDPMEYIDYVEDGGRRQIDYGPMITVTENEEEKQVTRAVVEGKAGQWVNVSEIQYTSDVDLNTKGNYTVMFSYTSEETNYSSNVELYVVVE